jgi:hypothetical protein
VVDKDGVLRYVEVLESAGDEPNYAEIEKTLAAL